MSEINLRKNDEIDLDLVKGLKRVRFGIAWEAARVGVAFDADISAAVLLGPSDARKLVTNKHFVFFNNEKAPDGSVVHSGDSQTGDKAGDDETITIDFSLLPPEVAEVTIVASIYEGKERGQDWSMINAVATLYDDVTGAKIATYPLGQDYRGLVSVQAVSFFVSRRKWTYKAIGAGYDFPLDNFVAAWKN